jgi:hypothetical protein
MVEPFSTIIISGAAGAAAGKLSEKAWESGEKWLSTYFKDHHPKAIKKAKDNSKAFLSALAEKVARLEEQQQFDRSLIDRAMEDPSFAALLQKALIGSSQTESKEKHQLLAQLLAGKLSAGAESFKSVVAPLACDAVVNATLNQLKILAIQTVLTLVHPNFEKAPPQTQADFLKRCDNWLAVRLQKLSETKVRYLDLLHLESLSCAKHLEIGSIDLNKILPAWTCNGLTINSQELFSLSSGASIKQFWEDGLNKLILTSTGQMLGFNMVEIVGGSRIDIDAWGEDKLVESEQATAPVTETA